MVVRRLVVAAAAAVCVGLAAAPAAAAGSPDVVRISVVEGGVNVMRGDSAQQVAAAVNAPLLPGDTLLTTAGGRAEAQFDSVAMLRLDRNAQVRFAALSSTQREVQLAAGTVALTVLRDDPPVPLIDTPSVSVRPDTPGTYRVTLRADGATVVDVRSGRADVETPNGARSVADGEAIVANGAPPNVTVSDAQPSPADAFDAFSDRRNRQVASGLDAARKTSGANLSAYQGIDGYGDLAGYGRWTDVPSYGNAWMPTQSTDWSPYQNGSWTWEPSYGYTWISSEPWGWAPYHYGRWFYAQRYGGWGWLPPLGGINVASTWAPALVGVVVAPLGGGIITPLNQPFGLLGPSLPYAVGWFPLGPGDPYLPWYGWGTPWTSGFGYGYPYAYSWPDYTPITNITYIINNYCNVRRRHSIAMVGLRDFGGGRFRNARFVDVSRLHDAALVRGGLPVVPTQESLAFSARPVQRVAVAPQFLHNAFAGHAMLPQRIPFAEQQMRLVTITRLTGGDEGVHAVRTRTDPLAPYRHVPSGGHASAGNVETPGVTYRSAPAYHQAMDRLPPQYREPPVPAGAMPAAAPHAAPVAPPPASPVYHGEPETHALPASHAAPSSGTPVSIPH